MQKRIGLVICSYNRPQYLQQCLDSLLRANLSSIESIMIVDDCSNDHDTINIIDNFKKERTNIIVYPKLENKSIKDSLLIGFDYFFQNGFDIVINLDSDALVRNDFVDRIMEVKNKYPNLIVTGFCCDTLNKDGTVRHEHLYKEDGIIFRKSVGGINMCINKEQYHKYVKPALIYSLQNRANWDDHSCRNSMKDSLPIACVTPSVIQHCGLISSMNHGDDGELADVADTFKLLSLPQVTLVSVDDQVERIIKAADISCRDIEFGAVKLLSCQPSNDPRVIPIEKLASKKAYSEFVFNNIVDYVETDFFLIIQHDGWIVNAKAWTDDFFKFDYTGAKWWVYKDGMNVGNGGVSLRSRKLHELIKNDKQITLQNDQHINNYAEDHNLGRIWRPYLEAEYGVKFAPAELADKFSIEAWKNPDRRYKGSFAFHGTHIDFSNYDLPYKPY